ncbi:MAG: SIR2 family protein, partial [Acidobacteriota bacterium]
DVGFLEERDRLFLDHFARQLAQGRGVLFAGAGLSFNARRKDGGTNTMPNWPQLAAALKERLGKALTDVHDVLRIADYYDTVYGRDELVAAVADAIRDAEYVPGRAHRQLVGLGFREIITTNFDTLIERVFRQQHISPQVVTVDGDLTQQRRPPRILKANGCLERGPKDIVLTGDDFLAYSTKRPLIETFVLKCFVDSQVVFVGFGLEDPAFRAINEWVLQSLGEEPPLAYSLQFGAAEAVKTYWRRRGVQIVDLVPVPGEGPPYEERMYQTLRYLRERRAELRRPAPPVASQGTGLWGKGGGVADAEERWRAGASWMASLRQGLGLPEDEVLAKECPSPAPAWLEIAAPMGAGSDAGKKAPPPGRSLRALEDLVESLCPVDGSVTEDLEGAQLRAVLDLLATLAVGIAEAEAVEAETADREAGAFRSYGLTRRGVRAACLLGTFHALLHLPMLQDGEQATEASADLRRRVGRCLVDLVPVLRPQDLAALDPGLRARLLCLLAVVGPVAWIAELVVVWTGPGDERGALGAEEATPDEDRISLLGFHGALQRTPALFNRAADSLWERHLVAEGEIGPEEAARTRKLAFRFRHLLRSSTREFLGKPEFQLHEQRLEGILGRLFLADVQADGGGEREEIHPHRRVAEELHRLWLELERGWVFGDRPPEALGRAWAEAGEALNRRDGEVPWLALVLMTLPLAPELFGSRTGLLDEAWRRGEIDLSLWIDHVAVRLGDGGFGGFPPPEKVPPSAQAPVWRYEVGLAGLLRWIFQKIDAEHEPPRHSVPEPHSLRRLALVRLLGWSEGARRPGSPSAVRRGPAASNLVARWLLETSQPKCSGRLLETLGLAYGWDSGPAGLWICADSYGAWMLSSLQKQVDFQHLRLGLPQADPPRFAGVRPPMLGRRALTQLLASTADDPVGHGSVWRGELEAWICAWYHHVKLPADLREQVLRRLAAWLRAGGEDPRHRKAALALAGRLGADPELRTQVEKQKGVGSLATLAVELTTAVLDAADPNGDDSAGETPADTGPPPLDTNWGLTWDLVPFAADAADTFVALVERFLAATPSRFQTDREGLATLLASLLRDAPEALQEAHGRVWLDRFEVLLGKGAVAFGTAGPLADRLSDVGRLQLQKNLIRVLHRRWGEASERAVGWIVQTLKESPRPLADLEETLLEAIDSHRSVLAEECLAAALHLGAAVDGFADRHRGRLRRIRLAVQAQGKYRCTSRFAAMLDELPASDPG